MMKRIMVLALAIMFATSTPIMATTPPIGKTGVGEIMAEAREMASKAASDVKVDVQIELDETAAEETTEEETTEEETAVEIVKVKSPWTDIIREWIEKHIK